MSDAKRHLRMAVAGAVAIGGNVVASASSPEAQVFQPPRLTLTNETYSVDPSARFELRIGADIESSPVIERALALAAQLIREESYRDATRLVDAVLVQRPDERRALVMRSALLTHLGRFQEALAVLDDLIERAPDSVAIKNNAAWIYATAADPSLRDGRRAVALAQEALLLAPQSYPVWSTMSEGYYVSGEFEKGLRFAQEAYRMAAGAGASGVNLREYRDQIRKNQAALHAFRLIE
jgi:predicted Zn-dependent protease